MSAVKITRSRQVTIPKKLFDELQLKEGDYVEVKRVGDELILSPKQLVTKAKFFEIVEKIWERNKGVDPAEVEAVVSRAIKEVRRAKRQKAKHNA